MNHGRTSRLIEPKLKGMGLLIYYPGFVQYRGAATDLWGTGGINIHHQFMRSTEVKGCRACCRTVGNLREYGGALDPKVRGRQPSSPAVEVGG